MDESNKSQTIPEKFVLYQNYPNPFNPVTTISFDLPATAKTVLKIFNILGQEIQSYQFQEMEAGHHSVIWDGRNKSGVVVSSGIYLYRLMTADFAQTRKMIFIR